MQTRISFSPPGWFAADPRVTVSVDGEVVHDGSFLRGFSLELELDEGTHELEARIRIGLSRTKRWTLEVPPDDEDERGLDVKLAYSRMWGTFEKALDVQLVDGPMEPLVETPLEEEPPVEQHPVRATWALLAVLVAVYAVEVVFGVGDSPEASPSIATLVGMGGLIHGATLEGEWFRVVSCTFLHGSLLHLVLNGLALVMAGTIVERLVGWRWFLALYFVGALAGSALSLAMNEDSLVSVGASGAIMSLFAAGLLIAQALPHGTRHVVQFHMLRVLVPSLLPLLPAGGEKVDLAAHFGGAIAGIAVGALLLRMLRAARGAPIGGARVATGLAGSFVVAAVAAMAVVFTVAYPSARAEAEVMRRLAPDSEIVRDQAPTADQVASWLQRFPDDPRVRLLAAQLAYDEERWDDLDADLARASEVLPGYQAVFSPEAIDRMRRAFGELRAQAAVRRQLLPNRDLTEGDAGADDGELGEPPGRVVAHVSGRSAGARARGVACARCG